jgi:hypothetical protein
MASASTPNAWVPVRATTTTPGSPSTRSWPTRALPNSSASRTSGSTRVPASTVSLPSTVRIAAWAALRTDSRPASGTA